MRWVHKIRVMMLAKDNDVQSEIVSAVKEFAGLEPKAEPVEESTNVIVTVEVQKESEQNDFLKRLKAGLGSQVKDLVSQINSRLHEEEGEWNFYLRLDKKEYVGARKMVLTDGGNCLHVRLTLAVFPKKREAAEVLVRKLFAPAPKKSI